MSTQSVDEMLARFRGILLERLGSPYAGDAAHWIMNLERHPFSKFRYDAAMQALAKLEAELAQTEVV